jgi:hypothetical protein
MCTTSGGVEIVDPAAGAELRIYACASTGDANPKRSSNAKALPPQRVERTVFDLSLT